MTTPSSQSPHTPNPAHSYQLLFTPSLGITAEEFAQLWNADPQRSAASPAQIAPADAQAASYGFPIGAVVVIVENVAGGIAGNALYELIKWVITSRTHKQVPTIVEADSASEESQLLIVAPADTQANQ